MKRLAALACFLLGACAAADASVPTTVARPDLPDATLIGGDQIVTLRDGELLAPRHGIVGMDEATSVGVESGSLVWRELRSGEVRSRVGLTDEVVPIVTDLDGRLVAMTSPSGEAAAGTIAPARTETLLVVVSPEGDQHRVTLAGNFVPEAFSTEFVVGAPPLLYLLEYLPAEAPTHYRVRLLDPATGELTWPYNLRDKAQPVDTEMAGISRDQVVATERGMLFTLYRGHHFDEHTDYAFVHVLAFGGGVWCLEVPAQLDLATEPGAVAVSPDERTLYVASANGMLAEYDIDAVLDADRDPVASRVAAVPSPGTGPPVLATTAAGPVVARGSGVVWLDADDLEIVAKAGAGVSVEAMAVLADRRLVVAGGGRLELLGGGEVVAAASLPTEVAKVTRIVPD